MDFLTGLRTIKRMCAEGKCSDCLLNCIKGRTDRGSSGEGTIANILATKSDEEIKWIAMTVRAWAALNPTKTMEDVFFEKFPAPMRYYNGCLATCPDELDPAWESLCGPGGTRTKDPEKCKKCWRRPVP